MAFIAAYAIIILAVPIAAWELHDDFHRQNHEVAWFVSGVFVALALPLRYSF